MTMTTDAVLLARYQRDRDALAFQELTRRYGGMVFATANRVTRNRHDAEDVAQACFLELARRAATVTTSVAGYLHLAALRRAMNLLRDERRRHAHEQNASSERVEPNSNISTLERSWAEFAPEIDQAIQDLPEEFREAVLLHFLRGMSETEVAATLGVRPPVIRRRLQVGIRRLRAALTKDGRGVHAAVIVSGLKAEQARVMPSSLKADVGRMALAGCLDLGRKPITRIAPRFQLTSRIAAVVALSILSGGAFLYLTAGPSRTPYDRLQAAYGVSFGDDFGLRAASISTDPVMFWRGTQPLFYEWSRHHAQDWLADQSNYVLCHGSPALEDAEVLETDPDLSNSARIPFQLELLQAMISARLVRRQIDSPERFAADQLLFTTYREALLISPKKSTASFSPPPSEQIERHMTPDGRFKMLIRSSDGDVTQLVKAVPVEKSMGEVLGQAFEHSPAFARLFAEPVRTQPGSFIRSAAQRLRVRAAASQGCASLMLYLPAALKDGGAVIVELRQATPSAAELAGAIPADRRNPALRMMEDLRSLCPSAPPQSWCDWNGQSTAVRILVVTDRDIRDSSLEIWARETVSTHADGEVRARLHERMEPGLLAELSARADRYCEALQNDFEAFSRDARVGDAQRAFEAKLANAISITQRQAVAKLNGAN